MKYARRVALLTFYSEDKKILLQKRDMKAPTMPGYWGFFGGGIENEETPLEAVKREVQEELGVIIENPFFLARYSIKQNEGMYEKFIYVDSLKLPLQKLEEQQKEGEAMGLFSIKEIYNLKFPKFNWIILEDIEKYLKLITKRG